MSDTPETDELARSLTYEQLASTEKCYSEMRTLARRLERERDKFHEDADAFLDKMSKYQERAIDAERKLAATRALADRLAGVVEQYYADDDIAHHAGIADALTAWKEARSE